MNTTRIPWYGYLFIPIMTLVFFIALITALLIVVPLMLLIVFPIYIVMCLLGWIDQTKYILLWK